ncbi:BZ3500_MvSof-1268-A1-R1_Chr2-2g04969 [Microbotryum saponariae]|uniref:Dihydroorotate dehydrogenase (quinone), mitochondrial n=1 Tax=Microbotryum saponariae TaxID=289078 RepID=A0A2X0KWT1_9BASI|nr:BZ3500_MvSof-1268-A1-R1_Chr2-2g04969 [Microbotryum saponariae]SDA00592.1 BZ3501_MvSof-1269-A2-R1_Chr2-2g04643 [Microbotryum saponariae]
MFRLGRRSLTASRARQAVLSPTYFTRHSLATLPTAPTQPPTPSAPSTAKSSSTSAPSPPAQPVHHTSPTTAAAEVEQLTHSNVLPVGTTGPTHVHVAQPTTTTTTTTSTSQPIDRDVASSAVNHTLNAVNDKKQHLASQLSSQASEASDRAHHLASQAKDRAHDAAQVVADKADQVVDKSGRLASAEALETASDELAQAAGQAKRIASEKADDAAEAAKVVADKAGQAANKTGQVVADTASKVVSFIKSTLLLLGTGAFLVYAYDSRAGVHRWVVLPAVMALTKNDPEQAHEWAVQFLSSGLAPVDCGEDDPALLSTEVWGQTFSSPIGMAAGWDKHAVAIDGLFNLGFSYVEVGSVTPEPQPGNPKPRLFRVPEMDAVVNRYGFNSEGHQIVQSRLRQRLEKWVHLMKAHLPAHFLPTPPAATDSIQIGAERDVVEGLLTSEGGKEALVADRLGLPRSLKPGRVLGINLGKNKTSDPDSIEDFVKGVTSLGPYADVLVINVSSPNTPGLRDLQRKGMMTELLNGVVQARNDLKGEKKPPILVKIAPDVDAKQLEDIAEAVKSSKVDGIIVSNTTISRPDLSNSSASTETISVLAETGGLSGPPVKPLALKAISTLYDLTDGQIPLVGCGGISSGQDAVDFAKAGASLVQVYTGVIYHGVGLPRKIKDELMVILQEEGKSWSQLVGSGRRVKKEVEEKKVVEKFVPGKSEKEGTKPVGEKDFADSLKEAKADLDALLKELASFGSTPTSAKAENKTSPTMGKADAIPPIEVVGSEMAEAKRDPSGVQGSAVPAPVAESFASNAKSTSAPKASTKPSSESTSTSTSSEEKAPQSVMAQIFANKASTIDDSKLAVPAQALLDEEAIKVLLDPIGATQQKKGDSKETVKAKEEKKVDDRPVRGEGKRWV